MPAPALVLPVDVEKLLVAYFKAVPELTALVAGRVSTALPATPVYPLVLLHRAGGTTRDQGVLDRALVQLEAWAAQGDHASAVAVMSTLRASLRIGRFPGSYAAGVAVGADEISGPTYLRDAATNAERFVWTVQVFTRPA